MVFTLHRYIFNETLRVFILAALALTLMLSLGSIIEPIQKYGVGPRQVVHLIGYSLPITLTFVLPMAALFATTMVYGRFASDNELDACRASGISMLTLVYPGFALAIMVATANLVLSFHVMPAFVHRAQKSIKADAKQILFRNIQRRGYYKLPGKPERQYRIYADRADSQNDTLYGVVVADIENGAIEKITTAESANVRFDSDARFQQVKITARNTYQTGPGGETALGVSTFAKEFPSLLADDIKFKNIKKMKQIAADPMQFSPVARLAGNLYARFTAELLAQDINATINRPTDNYYELYSGSKRLKFTADNCFVPDKEERVELTGAVVVDEYDVVVKSSAISEMLLRTLRCSRALLDIEGDQFDPTLTMVLFDAGWRQKNGLDVIDQMPIFRGLIVPTAAAPHGQLPQSAKEQQMSQDELILEAIDPNSIAAALHKGPSSQLKSNQQQLYLEIANTLAEIKAEIHSRLVFGIGCVPLIMIGIGLGIVKKDGHLLTAFGISAVPATILIVGIMTGRNITKNPSSSQFVSGETVIWSGVLVLLVLAGVVYRRLLKH